MLSFWRFAFGLSGLVSVAQCASLTQVTNWGGNPSGIANMYIYVPDKLAAKPPIILALHPCGGTAQQFYSMTQLPKYADQLGYILIYPTTTKQSNCWDCHSSQTLTHEGGGDSQGLANMVKYALNKYSGDASKVFVIGGSSGAMMTNVMAATYPDVFNAAAAWSGAPAGCWKGSPMSSPSTPDDSCVRGVKNFTPQQWGDLARACYPGYSGSYPRMMAAHGTADTIIVYALLAQQLAQWSNIHGVSFTRNLTNTPASSWTEMDYGNVPLGSQKVVGYSVAGGGHIPTFQEVAILTFFGLLGGSTSTSTTLATTTTRGVTTIGTSVISTTTRVNPITTTTTTTPTSGGGPTSPHWGQCGGNGWTGAKTCESPYTCKYSNDWYSQCL